MNIIQGIGGLEQSMKKNNDTPVVNENQNTQRGLHHNELSDSIKKSMRARIISAIVMVILVVPALILGDWIFLAVMTVVIAFACYEILGCAGKRTITIYFIYLVFVLLLSYWPIFLELIKGTDFSKPDPYYTSLYLPIIVVVAGTFLLLWTTVIYKDFSVVDASFLALMAILIGLGFQSLFFLRYYPESLTAHEDASKDAWHFTTENTLVPSFLIIFIILSTILTDIGAYFVGVFFGKHKMNERISPKKTWEGFWGGIIISFILTSTIGLAFAFSDIPIIPNATGTYTSTNGDKIPLVYTSIFDKNHWYYIIIVSAVIPFFATLGDFAFSSIKRYWGIKDYGKLIPGHGGVLDRLDSIFFSAIIAAVFIYVINSVLTNPTGWKEMRILI